MIFNLFIAINVLQVDEAQRDYHDDLLAEREALLQVIIKWDIIKYVTFSTIFRRKKKSDLCYKGYWLGGEGGGPYQYQANLVSRPNIAFARLDPGNFVLHLYEKALTVWSDVYIVQCLIYIVVYAPWIQKKAKFVYFLYFFAESVNFKCLE